MQLSVYILICAATLSIAGCSRERSSASDQVTAQPASSGGPPTNPAPPIPDQDATLPAVPSPYDVLPPAARSLLDRPFTGDLDQMVKRRMIRAGVVFNRTQYYIDKGVQYGAMYDSIKLFEDELNKRLKTGVLRVHVAFVPLTRDQLFPALQSGKVDFVAAALTVTPERRKVAAFSEPVRRNVSEIVVTAAGVAPVTAATDLSGREVFVRRSSSYWESLRQLNETLKREGRPLVTINEDTEPLEDDDILEMVNAGLVDAVVVDDYIVGLWKQVFPNIKPQASAAIHTGGEIAIGVRPGNPKMLQAANTWLKKYGSQTAFGNMVHRRYLENAKYVKSATADAERRRFTQLVSLFQKYGTEYNVDYLLMTAQGFQESRLDQSAKSPVGAIGIMQVMPQTGEQLRVGDIHQVDANVHAGIKYFRFMIDQYFKDEPMSPLDKALMTFASYNAGPGRIRQLRREAAKRGLDPNVWFGNVERVAAEKIGRETVQYISNIYKYYVAYRLVEERAAAREHAKEAARGGR